MSVEQHGPLPSSNFWAGRNGQKVDRLVLHTMAGWISGADARFHDPAAQVSAHFGVRVDGSLWAWVNPWDTAYHAGDLDVNYRSIGIEHEDGGDYNGPRPDALYARSAALVAQFCEEYGIPCVRGSGGPGIYDHRQVSTTSCPDALDTDRIIREAAALMAPPAPTPLAPPAAGSAVLTPAVVPVVDVEHEWASLYARECPRAGIRPEIALAQALHETGHFTFMGDVPAGYNNPCGLGATGGVGVGAAFASRYDGVVAHLQHLLMYFAAAHTPYCTPPTLDPRHFAHRGLGNDIHQLDGRWSVPGTGYGDAILALVPDALRLLGKGGST